MSGLAPHGGPHGSPHGGGTNREKSGELDTGSTLRACGAVVFRRALCRLQYLLIRQHDGVWGFPKGHVDGSESEQETALREVREETGLAVRLLPEFRHVVMYRIPSGAQKQVTLFLAAPEHPARVRRQEAEIADSAWLGFRRARRRLTYSNTREVLDLAHMRLRKDGARPGL